MHATMSSKNKKSSSFPLFLLAIFHLLSLLTSVATTTNSSHILYEVAPFVRVYQNGTFIRLSGTEFVPTTRVLSKDIHIPIGPNLTITARLFLPENGIVPAAKLPLLVYFHGGGFFSGSPFTPTYDDHLSSLAAEANAAAVSVNYRLAPDHPLPIAYEDSWLALKWVFSHSAAAAAGEPWLDAARVDFTRVYLGGDSAGANIAHNVAVRVGSDETGRGGIRLRGMFLNCPHFWGDERIGNETGQPEMMAWVESIWIHAYPNSTGFDDPLSNPAKDPNLSKLGCRSVLVYVAEDDVLRDRGYYYEESLKKSGWNGKIKLVEVKGENHVFNLNFPNTTKARAMLRHLALFLNK